jgi:3-oxoadipate enol-lactonase
LRVFTEMNILHTQCNAFLHVPNPIMFTYINSNPIYYIDEGKRDATPVVFLHGFPFSHEMWKGQIEIVCKGFRAIAYDIRGHGKSYVGEAQFTIEHHVDDLISMLDFLKIEKTIIVGLSMGGYITMRALERNPERFKAAVLCDTKSEADTNEGKLKRFDAMKAVRDHGSEVFAEAFAKNVFAPESFKTKPDAIAFIKNIIKHTPSLSIAGTLLALASRTDTTSSLSTIRIPTLILVGEKDITTPPANSHSLHEKITNSELHIIPNAAHMSNLENPEEFNRHLRSFLNRV